MASIIKASSHGSPTQPIAFNFEDISQQASSYLDHVRQQARQEADAIRRQAEQAGRQSARDELEALVETRLGQRLEALLPVVREVARRLEQQQHLWLSHWEENLLQLAAAIARRVIRRELNAQPEIALELLREALELAKGSPRLRIYLNPEDHQLLGPQAERVVAELAPLAEGEIQVDAGLGRGGCRIETEFGSIDHQIEAQVRRIEEELR